MRSAIAVVLALALAPTAGADGERLQWPLRPGTPAITRGYDAPAPNWLPGHRGVDLAGSPGQPVYAAGRGTVVYAGMLAGRPVVSIAHPGGLRTSYEPVETGPGYGVRPGALVDASTPLGRLRAGHPGCPATACLHWGAMWGPATRAEYVDPVGLLADTRVRLKPTGG